MRDAAFAARGLRAFLLQVSISRGANSEAAASDIASITQLFGCVQNANGRGSHWPGELQKIPDYFLTNQLALTGV
jgi:hypothetical protein